MVRCVPAQEGKVMFCGQRGSQDQRLYNHLHVEEQLSFTRQTSLQPLQIPPTL